MQSLWRGLKGVRSRLATSKILQFGTSKVCTENKLHVPRELMLSGHGNFQCGAATSNTLLRYMTTLGYAEPSSGQDSSAASPDVGQPQRIKFKRLDKTAKHIMNILDKEAVQKVQAEREIPDIKPGYVVQLKVEVPENKRRVSILKGIVIARRNAGLNTTFRLRRLVAGVGVESVFPLWYSCLGYFVEFVDETRRNLQVARCQHRPENTIWGIPFVIGNWN